MWRLVVFTVVILSSNTRGCKYKAVQIDNDLDERKAYSAKIHSYDKSKMKYFNLFISESPLE